MYSAIDDRTDQLALPFCNKAERLWAIERSKGIDSITNLAAAEFISMGYLGHGRDHAVLKYLTEAANMGARMGLFDLPHQSETIAAQPNVANEQLSHRYAAWGAFNWITLVVNQLAERNQFTDSFAKTNVTVLSSTGHCLPFTSETRCSLQSLKR